MSQLKRQFDEKEQECLQLMEKVLVLPAYEQVVIASHFFNLLDSRGAISVTERQRYVLRIGKLAHRIAQYVSESETKNKE